MYVYILKPIIFHEKSTFSFKPPFLPHSAPPQKLACKQGGEQDLREGGARFISEQKYIQI